MLSCITVWIAIHKSGRHDGPMNAEESDARPAALKNPLEDLLGYHLRRATAVMLADLGRRVSDLELTVTEMSILLLIEANPRVTQSEIGRILAIKRANMTPLAAGLLARGLISRHAVNGRSQGLMLTKAGIKIVAEAHKRIAENETWLTSSVPRMERKRLIEFLKSVWNTND